MTNLYRIRRLLLGPKDYYRMLYKVGSGASRRCGHILRHMINANLVTTYTSFASVSNSNVDLIRVSYSLPQVPDESVQHE